MSGAGGATSKEHKQLADLIATVPGNDVCADCDQKRPTWASVNLGIFVCIDCSGIHRMMGTDISFVRSTTLDKWDKNQVKFMASVGNTKANSFWACKLPPSAKINGGTDMATRKEFIFTKYSKKKWFGRPVEATSTTATAVPETASIVESQLKRRRSREELEKLNIIKTPTSPRRETGDLSKHHPSNSLGAELQKPSAKSNDVFDLLGISSTVTVGSGDSESGFDFLRTGSAPPSLEGSASSEIPHDIFTTASFSPPLPASTFMSRNASGLKAPHPSRATSDDIFGSSMIVSSFPTSSPSAYSTPPPGPTNILTANSLSDLYQSAKWNTPTGRSKSEDLPSVAVTTGSAASAFSFIDNHNLGSDTSTTESGFSFM